MNKDDDGTSVLNQIWYVRRADKITGPFPGRLVSRRILLGQIVLDDELSLDQFHWQQVSEIEGLIPEVMRGDLDDPMVRERVLLSKRWADERSSYNRRKTSGYGAGEGGGLRQTAERRELEKLKEIDYREKRDRRIKESRDTRKQQQQEHQRRRQIQSIAIALSVLAVVIVAYIYVPIPAANEPPNCMAQPGPNVVWSNCQLAGVSYPKSNLAAADIRNANLSNSNFGGSILVNVDLSYSNLNNVNLRGSDLSNAKLKGANLQNANLKDSNLSMVDLSYANLTGAKLRGVNLNKAILDKTIWVDGRECGIGSVGTCSQ